MASSKSYRAGEGALPLRGLRREAEMMEYDEYRSAHNFKYVKAMTYGLRAPKEGASPWKKWYVHVRRRRVR